MKYFIMYEYEPEYDEEESYSPHTSQRGTVSTMIFTSHVSAKKTASEHMSSRAYIKSYSVHLIVGRKVHTL